MDSGISREVLTQNFSVVATGDIENKHIEFEESTESPCGESDPQHPGFCKCKDDEIGPLCQAKVIEVEEPDVLNNYTLEPREIVRLKFKSDKVINGLELYVMYGNMRTAAWISPECHLSIHEYEMHVNFPIYEPEKVDIGFGTGEICVLVFPNNDVAADYHLQILTSDEPAPTAAPSSEPTSAPSSEPTAAPSSEPQPSNGGNGDGGKKKKNEKLSLILIIILSMLGVIGVAGIVAIIVLIIRLKKGGNGRTEIEILQSESATSNEPLRSPLLF